ncbi:HNH endonuclease [Alkaliphilus sp. AH-315-G20]|nr:HNH endonuclease [Alkaliphilus sp. AH-315-G20]
MIYVLDINGITLMPTNNAKARILLKKQKATVVTLKPFTIKLTYCTNTQYMQPIILGIDSGYLNVGFSAVTKEKELIGGEVNLLTGMTKRISNRSMYRTNRRIKLRYRKPRFDNRKIEKGWLAPSIMHKLDSHIRFIEQIRTILPISEIVIEVANFDIQRIKNPNISGVEYQQGEQLGFWNTREYVLHRDNHKCQNPNCKNKDEEPILEVHHILFVSGGGTDAPSNLITLCNKCHTPANHKSGKFLHEWQTSKPKLRGFKGATFMTMVRWKMLKILKEKYLEIDINHTYGFITKSNRIAKNLIKSHHNDAFVIAKGEEQIRTEAINFEQIRRNNRSLEKFYDSKVIDIRTGEKVKGAELNNGRTTRDKNKNSENLRAYRGEKISKGRRSIRRQRYFYQSGDLVKYQGQILTVRGTQNKGKYVALKEIKKVPRVDLLIPYIYRKGFA